MDLISAIESGWSWTGLAPSLVVGDNAFGNVLVKDQHGRYWRICPENLDCRIVAEDRSALDLLQEDPEFLADWHFQALVDLAQQSVGPLQPGYRYCLTIPATLGGEYESTNLASVPFTELIAASGSIAHQIADLPDGAQVVLKVGDTHV